MDYHGRDGLLSVTEVPYRTLISKAFVEAGSQIGLPVIDVNGEKQVGINYIQVILKLTITIGNQNDNILVMVVIIIQNINKSLKKTKL